MFSAILKIVKFIAVIKLFKSAPNLDIKYCDKVDKIISLHHKEILKWLPKKNQPRKNQPR